jgi:hypothetical protein
MKTCLAVICAILAVVIIILISVASGVIVTAPVSTMNGAETQFNVKIAYSYVGQGPLNASYEGNDGVNMAPVTLYPSSVVLNITKISTNLSSFDAAMEFYRVKVTTDTGLSEQACYFIGTNYKPSFSNNELRSLFECMGNFTHQDRYYVALGGFKFNMTENESVLTLPISSAGCYSGMLSNLGLWGKGQPNNISVSVDRIGYIAMKDGLIYIPKDATINNEATAQLSRYESGFLKNDNLIPADQLTQKDLFHPISGADVVR